MNVGDVLYLYTLHKKNYVILPVRIHEKNVKESIRETTETYAVEIPGSEDLVQLSELDKLGRVFRTLEEAENDLLTDERNRIANLIKNSTDIQRKYYSDSIQTVETGGLEDESINS